MKIALAVVALTVFALSLLADYKWRKWMAQRRADQNADQHAARSSDPDHIPRS